MGSFAVVLVNVMEMNRIDNPYGDAGNCWFVRQKGELDFWSETKGGVPLRGTPPSKILYKLTPFFTPTIILTGPRRPDDLRGESAL
jgi:hypothetical protein